MKLGDKILYDVILPLALLILCGISYWMGKNISIGFFVPSIVAGGSLIIHLILRYLW